MRAHGFTLGHVPDSFTHSTLGGWIATRSSGMQSDRYGDIADVTKGLRVVTPSGILVVRPIPSMSAGPSIREMVLGSEGRLGDHHRGDDAGSPAARAADDPGLPVSPFRRRPGGDAGDRAQRVLGVGHAGLRRATRRSSRLRCASLKRCWSERSQPRCCCISSVVEAGTSARCACRSSAMRAAGATSPRNDTPSGRSSSATVASASARARGSCMTRRSSTRPTSVTTCWTVARPATSRRRRCRGAGCRRSTTR